MLQGNIAELKNPRTSTTQIEMLRTQSDCFHRVQNCWEKEEDLGEFVNKLGSVLSGAQRGEARSLLVSFYCYSLPFPE